MKFLALFLRREAAVILAGLLGAALISSLVHGLLYQYFHTKDCDHPAVRNSARCQPGPVLFLNGQISTFAEPADAFALASQGGRLAALGSSNDLKTRFPDGQKVDLGSHRTLPGFSDLSVDLVRGGLAASLSLAGSDSTSALERIDVAHKAAPVGEWIYGSDWSAPAGGVPFPLSELDARTPDRPILLWRNDHRAAMVNSIALQRLGIGKKTPDPADGQIHRNKVGAATGLLIGRAAEDAYQQSLEQLPSAALKRGLLAAQEALLAAGLTRVGANLPNVQALVTLGELVEAGIWRLRVLARPPADGMSALAFAFYRSPDPEFLTLGGPWVELDAPPVEHGAALSQPYADGVNAPAPSRDAAQLHALLSGSDEGGLVVAHGDRALEAALSGIRSLPDARRFQIRTSVLTDAGLTTAAAVGAPLLIAPANKQLQGMQSLSPLPPVLRPNLYRFRALLDRRIPIAFGSDWPRQPLSPLLQLQGAISNQDPRGDLLLPSAHIGELLTLDEALGAMRAGAQLLSGQTSRGSLGLQEPVDLITVDRDIQKVSPLELDTTQVVMTVVAGEVVWRREGGIQFRWNESPLEPTPWWPKVIARQWFTQFAILIAMGMWPLWVLMYWVWRARPKPEPPRILVSRHEHVGPPVRSVPRKDKPAPPP